MSGRSDPVQVQGLGELVKALRVAEAGLDDLKDANQAAGRIVLNEARPNTPTRTGRLAASGRANRAARKANVTFGGARVPYGPPIHWGWPARRIAAQPWVTEAAASSYDDWFGAYEKDVQALLDSVDRAVG